VPGLEHAHTAVAVGNCRQSGSQERRRRFPASTFSRRSRRLRAIRATTQPIMAFLLVKTRTRLGYPCATRRKRSMVDCGR
jgi:hypothetical protein